MGMEDVLGDFGGVRTPAAENGDPTQRSEDGRDEAIRLRLPAGPFRRRKRKTNPSLLAMRQQEARYTRLVGGLTVQQKRRISSVRKAKGIRAAISAAKRLGAGKAES